MFTLGLNKSEESTYRYLHKYTKALRTCDVRSVTCCCGIFRSYLSKWKVYTTLYLINNNTMSYWWICCLEVCESAEQKYQTVLISHIILIFDKAQCPAKETPRKNNYRQKKLQELLVDKLENCLSFFCHAGENQSFTLNGRLMDLADRWNFSQNLYTKTYLLNFVPNNVNPLKPICCQTCANKLIYRHFTHIFFLDELASTIGVWCIHDSATAVLSTN